MEIDIFQMFRHVELAAGPALVIMGCVCPPVSHRDSLGRYINKYQNYNPNGYERRMWYDAFAFEAVVGQMSRATVVQIVRAGDSVKIGATPAVTAPLAHVPGYVARACNHPVDAPLHALQGQDNMVARISTTGVLDPRDFIQSTGQFNLVSACATATALNIRTVFLAEWDGSLSLGCGLGVMYANHLNEFPVIDYQRSRQPLQRSMGGRTGDYKDFYAHAESHRCKELFDEIMKIGGELPEAWPPNLEPQASINAGCMWFHAKVVNTLTQ